MRVPAVVRWPGHIPAGKTCDAILSTIDVLPTVLDLLDMDRVSLPLEFTWEAYSRLGWDIMFPLWVGGLIAGCMTKLFEDWK